ncbi:thiamine diphosphate-binding protein [Dactylonectria macrodidyma]|uniref:2-oxoisovalerate dehydrogenase subunit alpha n=1 Tax=Dactylonectria macrodidyma TaxID=307937 RepID=A0A9P9J5I7_9HYPO|nr:thiamine diphosphate-binding protein [Dactylonectria macrodidyma]
MEWIVPADHLPISTFHILNSENKIEDPIQITSDIPKDDIIKWYKNMLTVNILDSVMFDAQRHGRVSFYMVSHGEEGLMVGSAAALGPGDVITCQYREHGVFLQRGFELKDFMSQLTANLNDPGKGRNMPNHYTGKAKVGAHSVASTLGPQIPHAAGAAYALKMQDREDPSNPPRVAAAYFGEGAASEGDFHGALNMAAMIQSPVIFICRNNGYAISTPASEQYKGDGIASRGSGYGIETLRVDGTDVFAVYEATRAARSKALKNGGQPVLLELMSYRISHHSTSDDSSAYRSSEEVALWKNSPQRNSILRLRHWLEHEGLWDEERDKRERAQIRKDIIKELTLAEKEKKPALRAIFDDVYAELTEEAEAQRRELKRIMTKYPAEYDVNEHVGGIEGL